jgi:general secretion pathway protein G
MMMVVTLILMVATISTPIFHSAIVRSREAVLRDHLYMMRCVIDEFTRDLGRAPLSLDEIVEKGYLKKSRRGIRRLRDASALPPPTDPFTGSNETWVETKEDAPLSVSQKTLGIVDVHSGSEELSLEGAPYNSW